MTFFVDTNILLEEGFLSQINNQFYISNISINELENIKTSPYKDEETKYRARKLLHWLNDNQEKYVIIPFKKSFLKILEDYDLPETADSKIIATAFYFYKNPDFIFPKDSRYFVTNDLSCKTIARSIGLATFDLEESTEKEYTGFTIIENEKDMVKFYSEYLPNSINGFNLNTNEYLLILKDNKVVDKYCWCEDHYRGISFPKIESKMFGKITPKDGDPYQLLALDSLTNNQISMLRGPAGSGKSYLAFGYMFDQLEKGRIDKIVVFCNTVATKGSAKLGLIIG